MDTMKTLRQLHDSIGVTRRAMQGYEQEGLVAPTGRNKYGHLLYDEKAQKRIERILLYQQLGFRRKEIAELLDAPGQIVKAALEACILRMEQKQKKQEDLMRQAKALVKKIDAQLQKEEEKYEKND